MPGFRHLQSSCFACGIQYDAQFLCVSVLPNIEKNLYDGKCRKTLRGIDLHLGNAPTHSTKRSRQQITRNKATRAVHPAYFPDPAPSDFFVFGSLKGEMTGFIGNSLADILSEIRLIFQEISKETPVAVYDERTTRLEWMTERSGEYYHTQKKKFSAL
jgi:hypothetical protein